MQISREPRNWSSCKFRQLRRTKHRFVFDHQWRIDFGVSMLSLVCTSRKNWPSARSSRARPFCNTTKRAPEIWRRVRNPSCRAPRRDRNVFRLERMIALLADVCFSTLPCSSLPSGTSSSSMLGICASSLSSSSPSSFCSFQRRHRLFQFATSAISALRRRLVLLRLGLADFLRRCVTARLRLLRLGNRGAAFRRARSVCADNASRPRRARPLSKAPGYRESI